ncbi:exported hypothetical protein [Planktothrix serta PCC 8927]|uniref:Uncharacterized protein n=1 Tax=Planktothrix serta PCC 8927 TaxID=671068 RepID=A0A7Z9BW55_9CYAN|nr:exported hypothetical protein [Planktothrix serta PCC 8927]
MKEKPIYTFRLLCILTLCGVAATPPNEIAEIVYLEFSSG